MTVLGPYRAIDALFEIDASAPIAAILHDVLGDLRVSGTPQRRLRVTRKDAEWSVQWELNERRYSGEDVEIALYSALGAINDLAAHRGSSIGTVLHGGAVAVDGCGVVFVGYSGAGKSTLTAAMVSAGHGYIADEVAAVDFTGRLCNFHRPVGLREGGAAALGMPIPEGPFSVIYPLRVGGSGVLCDGAPICAIFLVDRSSTTSAGALVPVPPAQALFRLVNQTLGAGGVERQMFRRLEGLVRSVPVLELPFSHVTDGVEQVEEWMRGRSHE